MRLLRVIIAIILTAAIVSSCAPVTAPTAAPVEKKPTASELTTPAPSPTLPPPSPTPKPPAEAVLLFTGDIMFEGIETARDPSTGKYDFSGWFEHIKTPIQQADIAIGNLEAPVWDPKDSILGPIRFAAPPESIKNLKDAGFDVLTTANNHAMDQGFKALKNTINTIRSAGMKTTGTYLDAADRNRMTIVEHDGIKIAIFAYARKCNISSKGNEAGLNLIDTATMKNDIKKAKDTGCDLTVFSLHFGTQYTHEVNDYQKSVVQELKAAGADVVIGHHPHVIQPYEYDSEKDFFCAWSLGNLTTIMSTLDRQYSAMLQLTVRKNPEGETSIVKASYIPTWERMVKDKNGRKHMHVYDIGTAYRICKEGTDTELPRRYLSEIEYGIKMFKRIMGTDGWNSAEQEYILHTGKTGI